MPLTIGADTNTPAPHAAVSIEKPQDAIVAGLDPRGPPRPLDLVFPADLCATFGVCRETIWRWVQRGILAEPLRFGSRIAWKGEYIRRWIDEREQGLPEQPDPLKPHSFKRKADAAA